MITTTIQGGLGNQMFMYAAARAMSLRNGTRLALNLKQGFKDDYKFNRHLELCNFNIELPQSHLSTFDVPFGKYFRWISRRIGYNILYPGMKFVIEDLKQNPEKYTNNKSKNQYLHGYWGAEAYFKDYADVIKKDFTIKDEVISDEIKEELSYIHNLGENIVMLGVRRYQECKDPSYIPPGGLAADEDYYESAIKYIASKVTDPVFVVFSQAQEWVKENVDKGSYTFYYTKPKNEVLGAIEDLYLMTHCKHYIISNSTFYWWGAYLSKNINKIVVCPPFNTPYTRCKGWVEISKK